MVNRQLSRQERCRRLTECQSAQANLDGDLPTGCNADELLVARVGNE
jgi:hypothetical protein